MKSSTILAVAAVATSLLALALPATAAERVKAGQLRCEVSAGLGIIIASSKEMECRFVSQNGFEEHYHGYIRKFGLDIGGTDRGILIWDVFAATEGRMKNALAGDYIGVGASATVGVGLGANAMVGGSNREFALQPLSTQIQTGLDLAAGVSSMELRPGA